MLSAIFLSVVFAVLCISTMVAFAKASALIGCFFLAVTSLVGLQVYVHLAKLDGIKIED